MKILRKIMAVLLAIITVITSGALTCTPSAAAYSSALSSDIDAYLPIVTYATPSSGKSRIYPYKDSSCKSKLSNYWIDCYTEQIVVRDITANGKYAYVAIPSASGYKSFWFDTDDIFGLASIMLKDMYAKNSKNDPVKVYRLTGSSKKTSYGSFWEWDCHVLGTYKISGTTYYKTIYELSSSTKVNGVSGIKHKLGLITSSAYKALKSTGTTTTTAAAAAISSPTTTSTFTHPMIDYHKNYTQWAVKPSYRNNSSRQYHVGVDYMSDTDSNIYAFAAGTVVSVGWQNANGNYILIEHNIKDQSGKYKTVYSFYAHLKSSCVKVDQEVSSGTVIGTVGKTGDSSGGTVHLHFAIIDHKWTSGDVYGYATKFSGNKVKYDKVTYYNPYYVISKGKLP